MDTEERFRMVEEKLNTLEKEVAKHLAECQFIRKPMIEEVQSLRKRVTALEKHVWMGVGAVSVIVLIIELLFKAI